MHAGSSPDRFLSAHHNRTADGPASLGLPDVFVAEYGLPARFVTQARLAAAIDNVLGAVRSLPFVRASFYWEVFGNVPTVASGKHCGPVPIENASDLEGAWLVMPNGTRSYAFHRLAREIARGV